MGGCSSVVEPLEALGAAPVGAGPGVAGIPVVTTGVSERTVSAFCVNILDESARFECRAVARMAFIRRAVFCCLFGVPEESVAFGFSSGPSRDARTEGASSVLCFLLDSSEMDESMMGQTNPVRGV